MLVPSHLQQAVQNVQYAHMIHQHQLKIQISLIMHLTREFCRLPEKQDTFWSFGETANFSISMRASSIKEEFRANIEIFAPFFIASMARYLPIPLEPPVI